MEKEKEDKGVVMDIRFRMFEPKEELKSMYAHQGKCLKCGGIVKMMFNPETEELEPDNCWCLYCGQQYYMKIEDIKEWESEQWEQKINLYATESEEAQPMNTEKS